MAATCVMPLWFHCIADVDLAGAASAKIAPGGRVGRAGHIPFEDDAPSPILHDRIGNGHCRKQRLGVGMQGVIVKRRAVG